VLGEPHFRELEPAERVVAGGGFASTGRLSHRSLGAAASYSRVIGWRPSTEGTHLGQHCYRVAGRVEQSIE
jgi:hypothetical protein